MSFTYGFYNSVNNDRVYDAEQFSSIFDGIINDGIYMSIGGKMYVKANEGMTLKISSGRAWFNHTWSYNDSDTNITLDNSDALLNRIDAIVLEINRSTNVRANSFKVIKGTPATRPSRPALTNTTNIKQYPLAYVRVGAGVTSITQANITNMVGTSQTPFVTGIIETISITDLVEQWETQFNQWMANIEAENDEWTQEQHDAFEDWSSEFVSEMTAFKETQQAAFTTWFNQMKGQLSEDAAGNLQNEIDAINATINALPQKATSSQASAGTSDNTYMTPSKVNTFYANKKATTSQATTGTDDITYITPAKLAAFFNAKKQFVASSPSLSTPSVSGTTIDLTSYITSSVKKLELTYSFDKTGDRSPWSYKSRVILTGTDIYGKKSSIDSDSNTYDNIAKTNSCNLSVLESSYIYMYEGIIKLEIDLVSKVFNACLSGSFSTSTIGTRKTGIINIQGGFTDLSSIVLPSGLSASQQKCQINKYIG